MWLELGGKKRNESNKKINGKKKESRRENNDRETEREKSSEMRSDWSYHPVSRWC